MGTVEKLAIENMGIAFGILSLDGTEPDIHVGVIYPLPIATLGLIKQEVLIINCCEYICT